MKPVDQTKFGFPHGNCFAACVAAIFEVPIESLPDEPPTNPADDLAWWLMWEGWLRERNAAYFLMHTAKLDGTPIAPRGYSIAGGKSPRGSFDHAVVALDGNIVHDPFPGRDGLEGPIKDFTIFYPLDPSKPMRIGPEAA